MTLEKDHSMTFQKDDNSAESPSNDKRNKNDTEEEEEEEEEDTVVSAPEILALQRELEMEAARLYPGKFDKCTYDRGYINQPIYGCLTCYGMDVKDDDKATRSVDPQLIESMLPAAVCYSCSIACHSEHHIVELFHRRHFRCDCGNSKFPTSKQYHAGLFTFLDPCHVSAKKDKVNAENQYEKRRHNFFGLFCFCHAPYPDSETRTMFECILCEDWFHDTCIGSMPSTDSFDEYLCRDCSKQLQEALDRTDKVCEHLKQDCHVNDETGDIFLKEGWQDRLRSCLQCRHDPYLENEPFSTLFQQPEAIFVPEKDDDCQLSLYDAGSKALSRMDRVAALEGVYAMNELMVRLQEFLKPFAESGVVVTKQDILAFFDHVRAKRLKRME